MVYLIYSAWESTGYGWERLLIYAGIRGLESEGQENI